MKQIKNKYLGLLLVAGLVFSLSSCLKNGKYYVDFSKGAPAVELPLAAKYVNGPFAAAFDVAPTPTTYYAVVNVASVDIPSSPVTAKLQLDQAYLDQYNSDNGTSYELLPDSAYSIPSFDATIPAGHRQDSLPIMINTTKVAGGHQYVLPLTIASASVNISNWNHLMINVTTKNQWDGVYYAAVHLVHPAVTGDFSGPTTFSTVNANTVNTNLGVYPLFGADMNITINADNTLTLTSDAVSDIVQVPNGNYYDPATKTFYFDYGWGGGTRHINGTAVFQHK
jgi:hypothetical protein